MEELKYIIYCRKSREEKSAQVLSIQAQREECVEYASKNNLQVVGIYEESHSASKGRRSVFNQVINLVEAGQANALLVWDYDRLSRNGNDSGWVIEAFRERIGLLEEIHTPHGVFRKGDNIVLLYMYFGMSDEYSRKLSINVKRGNRIKLKLGQYPAKAPFGYRNYNRDNIKNIEPDGSAIFIKQMYAWYVQGLSIGQIKKRLNNDYAIPSKKDRKFSKCGVQKILTNKIYYGIIERNGELFTGSFESIITKELYDNVQKIMHSKSRPREQTPVLAFKQLIRCGACDSVYTGYMKQKYYKGTNRHASYSYYMCAKKHGDCNQKQLKEDEIKKQIIEELTRYEFDKTEWDIAVDLLMLDLEKNHAFEYEMIQRHELEIAKLVSKKDTLLELRTGKEITADEYLEKKNEYIDDIKKYEGKIKELRKFGEVKFERLENFAQIILQAQEILEGKDVEKKRNLVKSISLKLIILEGKVQISFKKPFSFFFKRSEQQKPYSLSGLVDDVRNFYLENPNDIPPLYL